MIMNPKTKIVIATHGKAPHLERTLHSILNADLPNNVHEISVVENGSKGDIEQIVDKINNKIVKYYYAGGMNKSASLNYVISNSEDDWFIIHYDDDIRLDSSSVVSFCDAVVEHGSGAFYGGPVEIDYEVRPNPRIMKYLPASAKGWKLDAGSEPKAFLGANWAAFVGDMKAVGGYNEEIGAGTALSGEETEIQRKMLDSGFRAIYVDRALIWHYVPRDRSSVIWTVKRSFRDGAYLGFKLRHKFPISNAKSVLKHMLKSIVRSWNVMKSGDMIGAIFIFSKLMGELYGKLDISK